MILASVAPIALFYDGSPPGLMFDCSINSMTMAQWYIIVQLIVELISIIYLWCFSPCARVTIFVS